MIQRHEHQGHEMSKKTHAVSLFERALAEMQYRTSFSLLARELETWREKAENNIEGFGIHGSQFMALDILLSGLREHKDILLSQHPVKVAYHPLISRSLILY